MWEPKYKELKELAFDIAKDYRKMISEGYKSSDAINELSRQYNRAVKSIYRYLNYAGVELKGRSETVKSTD